MEPGSSLPHSQDPATCPYPEPAQSSPCPHPTSCRSYWVTELGPFLVAIMFIIYLGHNQAIHSELSHIHLSSI
jgi:hypothetical protein